MAGAIKPEITLDYLGQSITFRGKFFALCVEHLYTLMLAIQAGTTEK